MVMIKIIRRRNISHEVDENTRNYLNSKDKKQRFLCNKGSTPPEDRSLKVSKFEFLKGPELLALLGHQLVLSALPKFTLMASEKTFMEPNCPLQE